MRSQYQIFRRADAPLLVEQLLPIAPVEIGGVASEVGGGAGRRLDAAQRQASLTWIDPSAETTHVFGVVLRLAKQANEVCDWGFDLDCPAARLQLLRYHEATLDHYDWHIDIATGAPSDRKITVVIQLSDPAQARGGLLQIMHSRNPDTIRLEEGGAVAFPSFLLHRVTPVTKGTRMALVGWACGAPFR
jgi:PKHD-type hydroxylase